NDDASGRIGNSCARILCASSLRLQAYRYDIKGLVLSPFGNASFAGVYREKQDEVKKP
ncbi:peptide ABC transporter substrate-binding protein SapA, partial [Escherichia sp. R-CC3]